MKKIEQIPLHIRLAVNGLLEPYGYSLNNFSDSNKPETIGKKYITIKEAEVYSGIGRWTLYRRTKAGEIKTYKLSDAKSGKVLIEKKSLDNWLESCKVIP